MSFTRKSEDSLAVRLVPKLGDPDEVLQDGLSERDEIVFDSSSDGNELVVGRGPLTGIVDGAVQSTAFRLSYDELCFENHCVRASLMVTDESNLYINGLPWDEGQPYVYLIHGDDVALDGLRYEYKVQIESGSSGPPSGKKRKAESSDVISVLSSSPEPEEKRDSLSKKSVSSSTIAVPQENADRITDEIQCSVCLDIQVRSRTLNPCGHSFCGSCLNQLEQCPQCREKIVSHVPALQLDGLIASLVSVPNLLDKDDVEHYNERKSSTCKKAAAATPKKKSPQRRRPRTARSTAFIPRLDSLMAPPFRSLTQDSRRDIAAPEGSAFFQPSPIPQMASRRSTTSQSLPPELTPIHAMASNRSTTSRQRPVGPGTSQQDAICID